MTSRVSRIGFCFGFSLATLLAGACGKPKEETPGIASVLAAKTWDGIFRPKEGGNFLDAMHVRMAFNKTNEFTMKLADSDSGQASGSYRDMSRHHNLILKFKESTVDSLGRAGTSKDFEYSIEADELVLNGKDGEFKLVESNEGDEPKDPKDKATYSGSWTCKDKADYLWTFDISTGAFWGRVTQDGKRATQFRGHVASGSNQNGKYITMKVDEGNNPKVIGASFRAQFIDKEKDPNSISVVIQGADLDESKVNEFNCLRS